MVLNNKQNHFIMVSTDFFTWHKKSRVFSQEESTLNANGFHSNLTPNFEEWTLQNPITGNSVTFSRKRNVRYTNTGQSKDAKNPGQYFDTEGELLYTVFEPIVGKSTELLDIRLIIWND